MRRLLKRCLLMSLALTVPAVVIPLPAGAAPPRGACRDPEPARPVVRQLPWAQQALDPQQVWPHSTGAGVTVAVIDSGVDADHPQLRGKVLRGRDYFLVGTLPGNYDCVSHGTAVAGIIAARRVPGVGFQGLAPDARILPVRISDREFDDAGRTQPIDPAVLARGIRYAVDQGARVINLSMSGEQDQRLVRSAVAYAVARDVVVVAAAGNNQQNAPDQLRSYPAAYDGVVGVGAIDAAGARLPGSQTGPYVDLVAPGGAVLGLTRQGGHAYRDGTSFAAPFVAATAALVRSAWPKLTAAQVVQRLLATATPARGGTGSQEYGAGIVSPFRAVTEGMMQSPARVGPAMVQPAPDPEQLAVAAWWHAAGAEAKALTGLLVAGAALVFTLGLVLAGGRRRRWTAGRTTIGRSSGRVDDEPPPEHLFPAPRT